MQLPVHVRKLRPLRVAKRTAAAPMGLFAQAKMGMDGQKTDLDEPKSDLGGPRMDLGGYHWAKC